MVQKVAIQGIRASFHEEAAVKFFGQHVQIIPCTSFRQTFESLKEGHCDYLVMAIENSTAGSLMNNYGLLRDYKFPIIGEIYLPIKLHLLALPGVQLSEIKQVISHPVALQQCADFLLEHPTWQIVESSDTAACAKKIKEEKSLNVAAIANATAAQVYDLNILERGVESSKKNFTRFLIIAKEVIDTPKKANKSSLCFQVGNAIGTLAKVLNIFAEYRINIDKIQSMPVVGQPNQYNFYVDIEWNHQHDYDSAIRNVLKYTINFNIMGEYQRFVM